MRVTFLTIFKIQIPDENLSFYNYYGTMMIDYFIKQKQMPLLYKFIPKQSEIKT